MGMVRAEVQIRGTRPMLWHVFGPDAIPLERKERTGVAGNDPEEWKSTVSYTSTGQLYINGDYIFSCLREGSKFTKKGRGSIQRYVAATLQVEENRILIDRFIPEFNEHLPDKMPTDPELPVYLDIRSCKNPATKARNVRYRVAASPNWNTTFHIVWDSTIVAGNQMEAAMIDSGKLVGLADGRSIGFGRFDVVSFNIQN